MHCPFCSAPDTRVIDSRLANDGDQVRRRRECASCNERFTTYESAELNMPRIVKQDGSRMPFKEEKLCAGVMRALEKRPVSTEQIDTAINSITHQLLAAGEREISSAVIGNLVMEQLLALDQVAYIRFASVYLDFTDVNAFRDAIEKIEKTKATKKETLTAQATDKQQMSSDVEFMQQAIRLANKGLYTTEPNPRVGCVIVKDGKIIGQGWHEKAGEAHAEINALKQAGAETRGATVYVTLEPCSHTGKTPPCADALIKAGVKKVIVAMMDPNPLVAGSGLKKLRAAGIETETGLLEIQARELNPGFIKRMESGRPFVRIKLAMSLDGRTAMASGESQWISGEASRNDVQKLRAESSAILTGVETVLADNPSMNVRLTADELHVDVVRQPKRIVLDSQLRMPQQAKIAALEGECIVYTTVNRDKENSYPFIIENCESRDGRIDLPLLLKDLAEKEMNLLHVEAGSVLCGALLKNDLVDEIIIYMAPHIMGDSAKGLFHLPGLDQMKHRISLNIKDVRAIGNDIRITVQPAARS